MQIVEVPEDTVQTEPLRNPRSGFIAYAPIGSIKKGETLVTTGGGGRTVQCGVCHGADLKGAGNVPGIAGRSPSYLVRQMYDMQAGTRRGPGVGADEERRREADERRLRRDCRVRVVFEVVGGP